MTHTKVMQKTIFYNVKWLCLITFVAFKDSSVQPLHLKVVALSPAKHCMIVNDNKAIQNTSYCCWSFIEDFSHDTNPWLLSSSFFHTTWKQQMVYLRTDSTKTLRALTWIQAVKASLKFTLSHRTKGPCVGWEYVWHSHWKYYLHTPRKICIEGFI